MTFSIDLVLVSFDQTLDFVINKADKPFIEAIRTVYMLNRNEVTHCCEIKPSYWLEWLYDSVVWNDQGEELDDDAKSAIYAKYENQPEADGGRYVHCSDVDRIIREHPDRVHLVGKEEFDEDEFDKDEIWDEKREYYNANWVL